MKKRKLKLNLMIFPVLLVLCLCVGIVNLLWPNKEYSYTENRPLAKDIDFSINTLVDGASYTSAENWFSDQFLLRDGLFHLNYLVRKSMGQKEIQDVFLGKGALLGQSEKADEKKVKDNVIGINDFCDLTSLDMKVMIAPSAAVIQKQKLPWQAPVREEEKTMDGIYKDLHSNIKSIDLRKTFDKNKDNYIYYKTDHHWTSQGAGLAAQEFFAADKNSDFNLSYFTPMQVSNSFKGTLANKTGSIFLKDDIFIYPSTQMKDYVVTWADNTKTGSIYDKKALDQKDQYELFLGKNQSIVHIETLNDSSKNLLIFKDSYANSLIQFLLPYYKSITIIDPRYFYDDIKYVIDTYNINEAAVIFSYNTFVTDSSLKDVLESAKEDPAPAQTEENPEEENQ